MKVYKMDPKERKQRGLAGREWVLSEESGFTSKTLGKNFIKNVDILLEKWKPVPNYTITKIDDNSIPNNFIKTPISLTPEFLKEIQSI